MLSCKAFFLVLTLRCLSIFDKGSKARNFGPPFFFQILGLRLSESEKMFDLSWAKKTKLECLLGDFFEPKLTILFCESPKSVSNLQQY